MHTFKIGLQRTFIAFMVMLLVGIVPVPVIAMENSGEPTPAVTEPANGSDTSADQPSAQVASPVNGTSEPTGSASGTYSYNPATGLYENEFYTWDPMTKQTLPKSASAPSYNPSTGTWDTPEWRYDSTSGTYHERPAPLVQSQPGGDTTGEILGASEGITGEVPASGQLSGTTLNTQNKLSLTNNMNSNSQSGNSIAMKNTQVGNIGSGNAEAVMNLMNLLQSQTSLAGGGLNTFTANIQGNVQGDFLIDPSALAQPANVSAYDLAKLHINNSNDASITNNLVLNAASGDAGAYQNTTAGNVASGDANAIANVINMINSVVSANQSFFGVINIDGNYTGNILMPEDSLNALLASTGPSSTYTLASQGAYTNTVNTSAEQTIDNNINLSAASGNATASKNTRAGDVLTGNGMTNLTILNLTGREVVAANSLLVFVNVMGSWVGLIMDAPAGSTAAALGGGVVSDATLVREATLNATDKMAITNNITANAATGDATADSNTTVGNIRSGNATATANIANIMGSHIDLTNWFGILFINVFGTWHGNFGVAKKPVPSPVVPITSGVANPAMVASAFKDAKVFAFTPTSSNSGGGSAERSLELSPLSQANQGTVTSSDEMLRRVSKVLAANAGADLASPASAGGQTGLSVDWSMIAVAAGLLGFALVGSDRIRSTIRRQHGR